MHLIVFVDERPVLGRLRADSPVYLEAIRLGQISTAGLDDDRFHGDSLVEYLCFQCQISHRAEVI